MTATSAGPTYRHRSYSQVNQLRSCGEQYRLARVERLPKRPSTPAVAGTVVHTGTEVVDKVLHEKPATGRQELILDGKVSAWTALEVAIEENSVEFEPDSWIRYGRATKDKPKGEDIEWFRDHGIPTAIEAYVDWRLANPNLQLAVVPGFGPAIEVPFNFYLPRSRKNLGGPFDSESESERIGDLLIHGWIDRIFTNEGEGFYPYDLKSGGKPKTTEQLGLYAAALNDALGWEVKWGFYVYELKKGAAKTTPPLRLDMWTTDRLAEVYASAERAIEQGIFIPNPGEACQHCPFNDRCEYAQAVV